MDSDYIKERIGDFKSRAGKPRIFETPEKMLEVAADYFEWAINNDFHEKPRPMTVQGFCIHAGINMSTWSDYKKREEYSDVMETIYQFMYDQKFNGATVGIFKEQIISRDLGLVDKQQLDHSSKDGTMTLSQFYASQPKESGTES